MSLRRATQYTLCRCSGGYEKELCSTLSRLYYISEASARRQACCALVAHVVVFAPLTHPHPLFRHSL